MSTQVDRRPAGTAPSDRAPAGLATMAALEQAFTLKGAPLSAATTRFTSTPVPVATRIKPPPSLPLAAPPTAGRHRFLGRRPQPRGANGRILGICGWATGLGIVGLGPAWRVVVAVQADTAPHWYEPTLTGLGLAGVVLTAVALGMARWRRLPWIALGLATLPVCVSVGLAIAMP